MKKIFITIAFSLFVITPSLSDDIRDFEIDGMSIGDSLLDFLNKKEINEYLQNGYSYKDNKYVDIFVLPEMQNSNYGMLQISIIPNENKHFIYAIG